MLIIRLQRAGKRNRSDFRIVLAEKEAPATKKFTEILGNYNPRTKEFSVKPERVQYWMQQHVSMSPTIHNLFVTQKIMEGPKIKAFSIPAKKEEPVAAPAASAESTASADVPAILEPTAEDVPAEIASEAPAETPAETVVTTEPAAAETPAEPAKTT